MIKKKIIKNTIDLLLEKNFNSNTTLIIKGVKQTARLWRTSDGDDVEFVNFCVSNYIYDLKQKKEVFLKISNYLESIRGHFNSMSFLLKQNIHEDTGRLCYIDKWFASYLPEAHFQEDFFKNKIAFFISLNYPEQTLKEKENYVDSRLELAYSRLGDIFVYRIPFSKLQAYEEVETESEIYISEYKIHINNLIKRGQVLFKNNKILTSHWGLRDEIKSNYEHGIDGLHRQQALYEVIKRIIYQEIPIEIFHSDQYKWDPFFNILYKDGNEHIGTMEKTVRYEKLICHFKMLQSIDKFTNSNYLHRFFSKEMEISMIETENLFRQYLSLEELAKIGQIISNQLKRELIAFDIWYDGFKVRNQVQESCLNQKIRQLYPSAQSFELHIPFLLRKLGFSSETAEYLAKKIKVTPARGSGHAWGASMRGQKSNLRVPIPKGGMDYQSYNTAIHELGHTVEQTLSLYNMDYYLLSGVPNTAFTEALAFVFQNKNIELLGIVLDESSKEQNWRIIDKAWSLYEIIGVSLLDISVWKWLYNNPEATAESLKKITIDLSKSIWNEYFYPVFKVKDQCILAIYSHMISCPLYLSTYAYGQIIEFQLEEYLLGKKFAKEIDRIFRIGHLTPNQWMVKAIGQPISILSLQKAIRDILNKIHIFKS